MQKYLFYFIKNNLPIPMSEKANAQSQVIRRALNRCCLLIKRPPLKTFVLKKHKIHIILWHILQTDLALILSYKQPISMINAVYRLNKFRNKKQVQKVIGIIMSKRLESERGKQTKKIFFRLREIPIQNAGVGTIFGKPYNIKHGFINFQY